jgi:hypothetical protein
MKASYWLWLSLLMVSLAVAGCGGGTTDKQGAAGGAAGQTKEQAEIKANLAKLAPEDQKLALAQRDCPITDEPLGSMGVPDKVMVQGQPVFLCCRACEKKAQADPGKTLAKVKDLKAKATSPE